MAGAQLQRHLEEQMALRVTRGAGKPERCPTTTTASVDAFVSPRRSHFFSPLPASPSTPADKSKASHRAVTTYSGENRIDNRKPRISNCSDDHFEHSFYGNFTNLPEVLTLDNALNAEEE